MSGLAAKQPLAGGFSRRGACPALSAPMQTGDGLLVRLNPVAGGLSPAQLAGLCDAAQTYGNGVIEVTARGSIQLRGLTEGSAASFAQAVDRLGISVRTGVPVQTGVLAGLDPDEIADPTRLAESIRTGIARLGLEAHLGPKVSVIIDGGGKTALEDVAADVRLTAVAQGGSRKWRLAVAGDAPLGIAEGYKAACDAVLEVLSEIAAMGREARARDLDVEKLAIALRNLRGWHSTLPPSGLPAISPTRGEITLSPTVSPIAEVAAEGAPIERLISPLEGEMAGRPEGRAKERDSAGSLIATTCLRDSQVALGVGLPFGHTTAGLSKSYAETAAKLGIGDIRPAPKRTLVAICGTAAQAEALQRHAAALGFVIAADDPRRSISACPGAPDCSSGHISSRKIAAEIASEYSDLLDGSMHLHVSGCAKGCAHPGAATLTLVGGEAGTGLVIHGTARDEPLAFVESDDTGRGFANIAALVSAQRRSGESTAQAIQRLGLSALAEAFGQGSR